MPGSYCIAIHVPLYTEGTRCYVASEWARALLLLRDSFDGRFDRFVVVAPQRPLARAKGAVLEPLGVDGDGFEPRPSLDLDRGKRDYWLGGGRLRWQHDVKAALADAEIGHMGLGDLYRPINLDALRLSLAHPVTTVFVRDTDEVTKMQDLMAAGLMRRGPDRALYLWVYQRTMRSAVAAADLSLLKGRALFDRYAAKARNPKCFQDTSYRSSEIVPVERIERRLADRRPDTPLRLVYCGRLVDRKGCDRSIEIVASARAAGAAVTLDFIGDGDQRVRLEQQVAAAQVGGAIRFLGERPYGPELLSALADYDGLLFSPRSEDTPRMIFDGYAAGLPLIASDIPYVRERAAEEGATLMLPAGDVAGSATLVSALASDRGRLAALTRAAHRAAGDNASDVWYRRRADWTLEAHEARRHR
jgi:glycosyltransferase involved in cell wall biosynthesis